MAEIRKNKKLTKILLEAGLASEVVKYSEAKWDQVHLNYNQTKVSGFLSKSQ